MLGLALTLDEAAALLEGDCLTGSAKIAEAAPLRGSAPRFGRFRSEADIERFSVRTEPVGFDPVDVALRLPPPGIQYFN